jgi:hypothetical protein
MIDHITQQDTCERFDFGLAELSLQAEELESLDALWAWDHFFGGVGIGLGIVGLVAAGAALT